MDNELTDLTKKQKECYRAIHDYWVENTLPPSLQDLANKLDKSKTATKVMVDRLQDKGYITSDGSFRSIRIVGMQIMLPRRE